MARRYHGARGHGQVAVDPLWVGSVPAPHVIWQAAPLQLRTVQPEAGQVTWHSGLVSQSTLHDDAALHSTWQCSPSAQPTEHGSPGWHWTSQARPPGSHAWLHGPPSAHTQ